jgi:hypothetical protein
VVTVVIMEICAIRLVKIIIMIIVPNVKKQMAFALNVLNLIMEMIAMEIAVNVQIKIVK